MTAIAELSFETIVPAELEAMDGEQRDSLLFGVVGIDHHGTTRVYNRTEAQMAGLDRQSVLGSG